MATTYRALLVANSTFPDDPVNLPDLEGPRNDAALLRDALCDREYGLFASDNVRMVQERPMAEVLRELEDFLRSASRQDTVLLYYSGHGVLDQSNEFFLCAQNTRSDRLRSTAIKASDVSQMIDESASATTLIFLDCCHSGRFKGGDVSSKLAGQGRFVVTSSRGSELAQDAHAQNHASLFTHHLVQGLMGQAPANDRDGLVGLTSLYDYVYSALRDSGRQVPQKRFEGSGDVPIAMRPGVGLDVLPADVVDPAIEQPILDVSDTDIDLGDVPSDEQLPPERVLVINRGGGTLSWTVRSSADWVDPVADDTGVDLHLRPVAGPNRANVYITDERTGLLKTIRVRVRVTPATAPSPAAPVTPVTPITPVESDLAPEPVEVIDPPRAQPDPEPIADMSPPDAGALAAPTTGTPTETPTETGTPTATAVATGETGWHVVLGIVAAVAGIAAGATVLYWSFAFLDEQSQHVDDVIWVREAYGPGILASMLLALVVGLVSAIGLMSRRVRRNALATVAVAAFLLAVLRLAEAAALRSDFEWMESFGQFASVSATIAFVAAVLAVAATVRSGVMTLDVPARQGGIAIALAVLWTISLNWAVWMVEDQRVGDHLDDYVAGEGWMILLVVAVIAATVACACGVAGDVTRGVLLGVATAPVALATTEIASALYWTSRDEGDVAGAWMTAYLAVSVAFAGWLVVCAARRIRPIATPP